MMQRSQACRGFGNQGAEKKRGHLLEFLPEAQGWRLTTRISLLGSINACWRLCGQNRLNRRARLSFCIMDP